MFIPRVYYPLALSSGDNIIANEKVTHYLTTVLRLHSNDEIIIFNGQGGEYHAHINIEKKKVTLHVMNYIDINRESSLPLHLGVALARGDRMDFVIQKTTELGVTSITPLLSQRCAVKLDEARSEKRMNHWLNIAISACEQSGRTALPTLFTPLTLKEWAKQPFLGTSIVFDIGNSASLKSLSPTPLRIAIGPESGWSESETQFMIETGFMACQLGPRTLRAETASIAAISLLQGLLGDLT